MWPEFVVKLGDKGFYFRLWRMAIPAIGLMVVTISLVLILLEVPALNWSVVKLLTRGLELFLPGEWATPIAWVVGLSGAFLLGGFTDYTPTQTALHRLRATRVRVYDAILLFALREEQAFRSGAERWTWPQRVRASVCFGMIHITNIWYSFAAGIALSLTGFGFMLLYLWYYRRYKSQLVATAAATTVHALYNAVLLGLLITLLTLALVFSIA